MRRPMRKQNKSWILRLMHDMCDARQWRAMHHERYMVQSFLSGNFMRIQMMKKRSKSESIRTGILDRL
jgi:hypothetical protein